MTEETAGTPSAKLLERLRSWPYKIDGWNADLIKDSIVAIESLEREVAAMTAERDELQKRIGYTAVPVAEGGANINALRNEILEEAAKSIEDCQDPECDCQSCQRSRMNAHIVRSIKTCTAVATALPTNETEGLRAELDAAKRALAERIKSKLFQQFIQQDFWHAHHVDLIWRMDGKDIHEEADWLKDIWYSLRALAAKSTEPADQQGGL